MLQYLGWRKQLLVCARQYLTPVPHCCYPTQLFDLLQLLPKLMLLLYFLKLRRSRTEVQYELAAESCSGDLPAWLLAAS